ncbi:esterase-like activity of phytase family protein [Haliangium sp.]|uniref:esterase-like activity of phytase family protein n=1 Tax=Haliangium sp. TaxID=2663208 RepID=UPI003D0F45BC
MIRTLLLLLLCVPLGCQRCTETTTRADHDPGASGTGASAGDGDTITVEVEDTNGLSGLARGEDGTLWAVPERAPVVIAVEPGEHRTRSLPLSGVPEGLDLESIAWLGQWDGATRLAVGTEGLCENNLHDILLVTVTADQAEVSARVSIAPAAWSAACHEGHGIEGLCSVGGPGPAGLALVAAVEHAETAADGRRYAPVVRFDVAGRTTTPYRVALTSDTGKLSAVDCRAGADGDIEVLAIERHFEVSRVIRFRLPSAAPATEELISSELVLDVFPFTKAGQRNFEGLAWAEDGQLGLLVDNQYGTISGPNEIVQVRLPSE